MDISIIAFSLLKNYIAVGFRLGIIIIYILYTYTKFKVKKKLN